MTKLMLPVLLSLCIISGMKHFADDGRYKTRVIQVSHLEGVIKLETDVGRCSGWIANDGVVITAGHCTINAKTFKVTFENGKTSQCSLLKTKFDFLDYLMGKVGTDVSILSCQTYNLQPLIFGYVKNKLEACNSYGYGGDTPVQKYTQCYVGSTLPDDESKMTFFGDVDYGDSGGPVIDSDGFVIGMNNQITTNGIPEFFSIPVEKIQRALDEATNK